VHGGPTRILMFAGSLPTTDAASEQFLEFKTSSSGPRRYRSNGRDSMLKFCMRPTIDILPTFCQGDRHPRPLRTYSCAALLLHPNILLLL